MERFRIKNNRNAQAVDQTLKLLKPGNHSLVKNDDGSYCEVDGCFEVESDNAKFVQWAGVAQGYFELPGDRS